MCEYITHSHGTWEEELREATKKINNSIKYMEALPTYIEIEEWYNQKIHPVIVSNYTDEEKNKFIKYETLIFLKSLFKSLFKDNSENNVFKKEIKKAEDEGTPYEKIDCD